MLIVRQPVLWMWYCAAYHGTVPKNWRLAPHATQIKLKFIYTVFFNRHYYKSQQNNTLPLLAHPLGHPSTDHDDDLAVKQMKTLTKRFWERR